MALIDAGLYKVTLKQTYTAQRVINVFWFVSTLGLDDLQTECGDAFAEDIMPTLKSYQSASLTYDEIVTDNVTGDLAPVITVPPDPTGLLAGTNLSSFVALAVRLNRTTKDTRNGQKRFCGQIEQNQTANFFGAAYIATFPTLEALMAVQISTVGGIFDPVIVRPPVAPSAFWTTNAVASATASDVVSTQNSRKFGVGQ